jgi:hypothetical protein
MDGSVLKTLAYADIFDFPLTSEEIHFFLISPRALGMNLIKKEISKLGKKGLIGHSEGFYFLPGRKKLIVTRKGRRFWVNQKVRIAKRVANYLRLIPWIRLVGVTGALSIDNSKRADDIDLLIVTAQGRLWLTRALTVLLTELVARRRRPQDTRVKDEICLNMFLDEKHLEIPDSEKSLFTAHEVCQLKSLWDKDDFYKKFLAANSWVKKYLANAIEIKIPRYKDIERKRNVLLDWLEQLAYRFQLRYMEARRTVEITEPGRIRFHPHDCSAWVMLEYFKKLKTLGL